MANDWHTLSGNTVALDLIVSLAWKFICLISPPVTSTVNKNLRSLDVKLWTLKFGKGLPNKIKIARLLSYEVLSPLQ